MFGIESDSDIVECPYNKAHRILRKRLQTHLIRCRKYHPDVELQKCPFNLSHLIPEPEYVNHVATCPDRKLITQYMYKAEDRPKQEEIIRHEKIEDEENWDDTEAPDFKPKRFIEAANIKLERKPNIRALKREWSMERSRSRSPVYRPYENDPATSSGYSANISRSSAPSSLKYELLPPLKYEFPSRRYEPPSLKYEPSSLKYEFPSRKYVPPSRKYEQPLRKYEPPPKPDDFNSIEIPMYDLDDDPYYKTNDEDYKGSFNC